MPSQSSPALVDRSKVTINGPFQAHAVDARSRAAAKRAATVRRRGEERRTERLAQIQAQIADGTLVVRQMTIAERTAVPR